MSFPQQPASQAVINYQEVYRLFTTIQSSGDIYELDVGASALVIGPNSDIARVNVTYLDPQGPGFINQMTISVDDPFFGRIIASNPEVYPQTSSPARILVSPADLIPLPPTTVIYPGQIVSFIPPKMDLLAYFGSPPAAPPKRADFSLDGRLTIVDSGGGTGSTVYRIPYYRRRFLSMRATNIGAIAGVTVTIQGVVFSGEGANSVHIVSFGPFAINAGLLSTTSVFLRASTDGLFDYLFLTFLGPAIDAAAAQTVVYSIDAIDDEA